jgi:hypothetical protein
MKKLLLVLCVAILSFNVYANGSLQVDLLGEVSWTPVNIVFFRIAIFNPGETEVRGILLSPGVVMSQKDVYGINLGIATLLTGKCYGASINVFSLLNENNGLSLGLFNMGNNNGITLGLCNLVIDNDGISFGVINLLENNAGVSIGLVNRMIAGGGKSSGTSVGVANISQNSVFQFGIYNQSEGGFQLGLLNYNSRSYIPWLPLVNWDMGREVENDSSK